MKKKIKYLNRKEFFTIFVFFIFSIFSYNIFTLKQSENTKQGGHTEILQEMIVTFSLFSTIYADKKLSSFLIDPVFKQMRSDTLLDVKSFIDNRTKIISLDDCQYRKKSDIITKLNFSWTEFFLETALNVTIRPVKNVEKCFARIEKIITDRVNKISSIYFDQLMMNAGKKESELLLLKLEMVRLTSYASALDIQINLDKKKGGNTNNESLLNQINSQLYNLEKELIQKKNFQTVLKSIDLKNTLVVKYKKMRKSTEFAESKLIINFAIFFGFLILLIMKIIYKNFSLK